MGQPWNANIHYDAVLDHCVPEWATSVLDVGCGDGFLAARLAKRVPRVTAIDIDAAVLARAQARYVNVGVTWRHGDILTYPFEPESFDAVVSNATLHHLQDTSAGLHRMRQLVRPGGTLAVVGLARTEWRDWPWAAMAFVALGLINRVRGKWEHSAPQAWPPPHTFRQLRRCVDDVLPGAALRRLLLGRYLLTWQAATSTPAA